MRANTYGEQNAITTLSIRRLGAKASMPTHQFSDLSISMDEILQNIGMQLAELKAYKAKYGDLDHGSHINRLSTVQ
jgi:hypothetical protein